MTGPILTEEVIIRVRTLAAEEAKRVLAGLGEQQKKNRDESTRAIGEFQKLAAAQRQATADFRAGITTQEQYRAEMQRLRLEAVALRNSGLQPAGKELSAFSALMTNTATTSAQASRVLVTMRNSLGQVSATALGASGRWGQLAASMLPLGLTGGVTIAVVAGAAALAKGLQFVQESADEARKRIEALAKANLDWVASQNASAGAAQQLFGGSGEDGRGPNLIEQLSSAQRRLNVARIRREQAPSPLVKQQIQEDVVDPIEQEVKHLQQRIAQLRADLTATHDEAAETGQRAADSLQRTFDTLASGMEQAVAAADAALQHLADLAGGDISHLFRTPDQWAAELAGAEASRVGSLAGAARAQLPGLLDTAGASTIGTRVPTALGARARAALNATGAPFDPRFVASQAGSGAEPGNAAQAAAIALRGFTQAVFSGKDALTVLAQSAAQSVQTLIGKQGGLLGGLFGGLAGGLLSYGIGKLVGGTKSQREAIPVRVADVAPSVMDDLSKRITPPQEINLFRGSTESRELGLARARDGARRQRSPLVPRNYVPGVEG